jgi:uncharacterized membrane protein
MGFLGSLFDVSFNSFVTTKLIKGVYVIGLAGALLFSLTLAAAGLLRGGFFGFMTLMVAAPLVFLLSVLYFRVLLELVIVVFRMAEHMAEIARNGRATH